MYIGLHRLGLEGEFGWLNSKSRRWLNMIRFWNRLINMRNNRLTNHAFLSEFAERRDNWCSEVLKYLRYLDIEFLYDNFLICNIDVLEQQLRDLKAKTWKDKKDRWDSGKPRRQQILFCDIQIKVVINHRQIYVYHTDLLPLNI